MIALLLALATAPEAHAAKCLTLVSQNALHMGWDDPDTKAVKKTALDTMQAAYAAPSLILYQEVMDTSSIAAGMLYGPSQGATSTYQERYGFTPKAKGDFKLATKVTPYSALPAHTQSPSRPPTGIAGTCGKPANQTVLWFLSFHAIYGDKAPDRHKDVKTLSTIVQEFFACKPNLASGACTGATAPTFAIVGGDWNLSQNQVKKDVCVALIAAGYKCTVYLNAKTSINRKTATWSMPYDHFVVVTAPGKTAPTITGDAVIAFLTYGITVTGLKPYVDHVSDHIGVVVNVEP